jgi:hypothetical protein
MGEPPLELPENARCANCGYSLHQLQEDRCPECGNSFDRRGVIELLNRRNFKRPFDRTATRMLGGPPWWATVAAAVACFANYAAGLAVPNEPTIPSIPSLLLFVGALAALVLRAVDHARVGKRYDLATVPTRRKLAKNWIVLPLVLLLFIVSLGDNEVAERLAFLVSLRQMNALARQVISTQKSPPDQWVGAVHAVYICPTADGMNFRLAGCKEWGFAYTTTGQPPGCRPEAEPFGGGWYFFHRH